MAFLQIQRSPPAHGDRQIDEQMKAQGGDERQSDIHRRPRRRDKHHADTGIAKGPEINRDGLCVSEQERRPRQQQEARQKNCAKRVYMPERIEADTSKPRRRFITEETGDISVSGFVKSDGNKDRQQPD